MRALCFGLLVLSACSNDTFATVDGGGDGGAASGDAADACGPSFCASQTGAAFCSDFDVGTFGADWSRPSASNFPMITIGTALDHYASCPQAMRVGIDEDAVVATPSFSFLEEDVTGATVVKVDLDALLPQIAPPDGGNVDGFTFLALRAASDPTYYTSLERSGDGAWFIRIHQGASGGLFSAPVPGILVAQWNHLSLTVALANDSSGYASLTYDTGGGSQTATTTKNATLPSGNNESLFDLGALRLSPTTQHYDVFYDNVVIAVTK